MKDHSRIDTTEEDDYVSGLITGARRFAEIETGLFLITQELTITFDRFLSVTETIILPAFPIQIIDQLSYVDENGDAQQLVEGTDFQADITGEFVRIAPMPGMQWPTTQAGIFNAVTIVVTAGFGIDGTTVPEELNHAIKLLAAHWYERRETVANEDNFVREIPYTVARLLMMHRKRFDFGTGGY